MRIYYIFVTYLMLIMDELIGSGPRGQMSAALAIMIGPLAYDSKVSYANVNKP
jgi:hypothetical protein